MLATVAVTADQVGQIVTFVAPGFVARQGYRLRYPAVDRPAAEVLIVSVVLSLPLVAIASSIFPSNQAPTDIGYVAALLTGSAALGYVVAWLRGTKRGKKLLAAAFDYRIEPEGSIYSQTLKKMSPAAAITVELKDGRRISGTPRNGPESKDDGINELYLTYPAAQSDDGWEPIGQGMIVPLSEISNIVLSEEPTGA